MTACSVPSTRESFEDGLACSAEHLRTTAAKMRKESSSNIAGTLALLFEEQAQQILALGANGQPTSNEAEEPVTPTAGGHQMDVALHGAAHGLSRLAATAQAIGQDQNRQGKWLALEAITHLTNALNGARQLHARLVWLETANAKSGA